MFDDGWCVDLFLGSSVLKAVDDAVVGIIMFVAVDIRLFESIIVVFVHVVSVDVESMFVAVANVGNVDVVFCGFNWLFSPSVVDAVLLVFNVDVLRFAAAKANDDADKLWLIVGTDAIFVAVVDVGLVNDCVGIAVGSFVWTAFVIVQTFWLVSAL